MNYKTDLSDPRGEEKTHVKYARLSTNTIVEIGVLYGDTTKILLNNTQYKVVGIDPIIPDSMNVSLVGDLGRIEEIGKEYDKFSFIKDYSYNVVKTWNEQIGYLFIDGDHNYDAVKRDFEDWFPWVADGGFISIHDSTANRGGAYNWPGPSKLADELILDPRVEYLESAGVLTVFKKTITIV
jgi:hypothetical protein